MSSKSREKKTAKKRTNIEKSSLKQTPAKNISQFYESDDDSEEELKVVRIDPNLDIDQYIPKARKKNNQKEKKPRTKSEPKTKKTKQKVTRSYMKGKYNSKVSIITNSKISDSKDKSVFIECCVTCSNRNAVRASKENNIPLMRNCIKARDSLSTIVQTWSKEYNYSCIEYALINGSKEMLSEIFGYLMKERNRDPNRKPRIKREESRISLTDTGENSEYMIGTRVRKLNTTRGNKMGNNAFLIDDCNENDFEAYSITRRVCDYILKKGKDPSMIEYIKSLVIDPSADNAYNPYKFDFETGIVDAVRAGNKIIAGYLLKKSFTYNNYGFNALHSDVLNASSPEEIQIKVKTSLTKKATTNMGIAPIHVVCINPDSRFLQRLVELGADWNFLDLQNRKPIHYAAACEGVGPLNYLISLGALIDEGDKSKVTPLMIACEYNRIENAMILIDKGANVLIKNRLNRNSAFHIACEYGHLELVKKILEKTQIKIDVIGRDGYTGLNLAAQKGHLELVKYLIEKGAKVTKRDKFKRTPLINAIRSGQTKIVSYLLSKGSEFDYPDSSKNSPLHYACAYGWIEMIELLLKAGANPSVENDWRVTPLEIAFLKNHMQIVKYLLNFSFCDVNTSFNKDMRLLHYSFMKITPRSLEEMRYFINDKNADVNLQNYYGESVLHLLAKFDFNQYLSDNKENDNDERSDLTKEEKIAIKHEKHKDLIKKIFGLLANKEKLSIDLITKEGKTPFQIALEKKNSPFIEEIITRYPKLTFQDSKGVTIFHLLTPFVFGDFEDRNLVRILLSKLNEIPIEEIEGIVNSHNEFGFTPFLHLMFEYSNNIKSVYQKLYDKAYLDKQIELYEKGNKWTNQIQIKNEEGDPEEDEDYVEEEDENDSEVSEKKKTKKNTNITPGFANANTFSMGTIVYPNNMLLSLNRSNPNPFSMNILNNSFNNNNNIFGGNLNVQNSFESKEEKIKKIVLNEKEKSEVFIQSKILLDSYLDYFLSIIKQFIALRANPYLKVGKIAQYRIKLTNTNTNTNANANENKNAKDQNQNQNKKKSKNKNIEIQYHQKNGKKTPLMYLMSYPHEQILDYFLNSLKLNINDINLYRENALFHLINSIPSIFNIDRDYILPSKVLNTLLMKQINISQIDWKGNTTFFLMSKLFITDLMKLLHLNGSDINKCNKMDENALIYYVRQKKTQNVKILIEQFKVDINYQNSKGRTCMHYLYNDETNSTNTDESLSDFLLSCKPNLNLPDILGRTPIHYLFVKIRNEYTTEAIDPISSLTKLLEYGDLNIQSVDIFGNTPLHYAAQRGSIISILTLFERKVDINIENNEKNSPLAYCLMFNQPNAAISFIQQGVNMNTYAHEIAKRDENDVMKKIVKEVKEAAKISINSQMNTSLSNNISYMRFTDINSNFDLSSCFDTSVNLNMQSPHKNGIQKNSVSVNMNEKIIKEEDVDDNVLEDDKKDNESESENEENEVLDETTNEDYSNDDNESNDNNGFGRQYNNYNIFGGQLRKNNAGMGFGNNWAPQNRIANVRKGGFNRQLYNNNNNKFQNEQNTNEDYKTINNKYFITQKEKEQGIKLFRICMKNDYQGLTYLFLSKGYPLMSSIEDSFYERKFNLSKKLLVRSPNKNIYTVLNERNQSLFHILGKIATGTNDLVKSEYEDFFEILYSKGISLSSCDNEGNTPLHYAAENHFLKLCQFIINKENTQNLLSIPNQNSCTPFINAIKSNGINSVSFELINLLFSNEKVSLKYEDISYENNYVTTPVIHCVRNMLQHSVSIDNDKNNVKIKILNKLIENGANLNEVDSYQRNALMYCVIENNVNLLKHLVSKDKRKTINKQSNDIEGKTIVNLCVAVNSYGSYENEEMLSFLLENGFDSKSKDNYGFSPLDYAMNQQSGKNMKILMQFNSDFINVSNEHKFIVKEEIFDQPYNYEKDSHEYYLLKEKEAPEEKKKKIPNLDDYRGEEFDLYCDEQFGYWDASLTKVNIQNGIYGEYMFYFIQLVHDKGKQLYIVTTQFGRIGEEGANQRSPFTSLSEAQEDFKKIFKSKTGNLWEEKDNFQRIKGKYMLLQFNQVQLTHKELLKPINYSECPNSKIKDLKVQELIKTFTNSSIYFKALQDSGINTEFFNFSMLNKELLLKARDIMMEILRSLEELDSYQNSKKDQFAPYSPEQVDKISDIWNNVYTLSSRYYELIPKEKYKHSMIRPFGNIQEAKEEISILDNLANVERAVCILLGALSQSKFINPMDYIYNALQTKFEIIKEDSDERMIIEKYIHQSVQNAKIVDIFKVIRKDDIPKLEKKFLGNRLLLFHGTKVFNYIGIFSNGLKIAPPEAPVTGYLFGKGLYFADMYSKSINYCDIYYDKEKKKRYNYIMLCEVICGKIFQNSPNDKLNEFNTMFLNEGYNSFKALCERGPEKGINFVNNEGLSIPIGRIVKYIDRQKSNPFIQNNIMDSAEYVIYDTSQVIIRYLIKVEAS